VGCAVAYFQSTAVRNLIVSAFKKFCAKTFFYLFRFLDHNFPITGFTFATMDQLAIGSALLFISKGRPVPPAPQEPQTTMACVLEKVIFPKRFINGPFSPFISFFSTSIDAQFKQNLCSLVFDELYA
jgi:hypothetical protein